MVQLMKKAFLSGAMMLLSFCLNAQKQTLNDVLTAKTRGTGAILKDNTVNGYFTFYELDKKDRKTKSYQLNIFDQNLASLSQKKFTSQEDLTATEAAYNGDLVMIKFYDSKAEKYNLKSFNQNAEQIGSKSIDATKTAEVFAAQGSEESESSSLFPIENKGFINLAIKYRGGKTSHTYNQVTFIPDAKDGKSWTWETSEKSEDFESSTFLGNSDNVVLFLVSKRPKLMSMDMNDFVLGIDINTGKKMFEISVEDSKYAVSTLEAIHDKDGNFLLFGLYFEKDAKINKAKSLGLFSFGLSPEGKITSRKYISWGKDIAKFLPSNDKGKIDDIGYLYFHKFVKTADGKIFAVAEQYKNNTAGSVGAMALGLATRSGMNVKMDIEDMYILEFDGTFTLKKVSKFDKTKNGETVPVFFGAGPRLNGLYLRAIGAFDYEFTQISKDKSKFTVGYVDYEKAKGDKGWYFGSINYAGEKLTTDRVKFDTKATWQHVYPGKPGYIMITEYFRKEKKLDFRMEKVNF